MRLISSPLALRLLIALAAGPGLPLVQASRAIGASVSGTKKALEILRSDGLAVRLGDRYVLAAPEARELVAFATRSLPADEVLRSTAAGTGVIEFVGVDGSDVLVVFGRGADPLEESRAARRIEEVLAGSPRRAIYRSHDDVRRGMRDDEQRPGEYQRFRPILGDPAATFPRAREPLSKRASTRRQQVELPKLSRRRAAALKARYGIASATLFGSVARGQRGPASDVDVAVRFSSRPTLRDLLDLERDLEDAFDRDVDLVLEDSATPWLRGEIERDGVPLLR